MSPHAFLHSILFTSVTNVCSSLVFDFVIFEERISCNLLPLSCNKQQYFANNSQLSIYQIFIIWCLVLACAVWQCLSIFFLRFVLKMSLQRIACVQTLNDVYTRLLYIKRFTKKLKRLYNNMYLRVFACKWLLRDVLWILWDCDIIERVCIISRTRQGSRAIEGGRMRLVSMGIICLQSFVRIAHDRYRLILSGQTYISL